MAFACVGGGTFAHSVEAKNTPVKSPFMYVNLVKKAMPPWALDHHKPGDSDDDGDNKDQKVKSTGCTVVQCVSAYQRWALAAAVAGQIAYPAAMMASL